MIRSTLAAGALWLWLAVDQPQTAWAASAKDADHQRVSQDFFTNGGICQLRITVPPAAIELLKKESRKFVTAEVREGTNLYADVGIHLKGNSTFRPIDGDKPSLTLKFNLNRSGQRFHGLAKISLNNSLQDPSYINEPLCTGLFRALGVPVARVSHARVWLNERYLGLYVLVEGMTKDFLKLNFKSSDGNLYEANAQEINEELEQINGTITNRGDLKLLAAAAQEPDAAARWQRLHKLLDVDGFISMMAGEVLMSAWDGYYNDCNNYRVYHDTASDRMILIPHGLDNMFQVDDAAWRPELHSLLCKALLQTSEGQDLYRVRFWTAFDGPFRTELLLDRVELIATRLRPAIGLDGTNALYRFEKDVATLRQRVANRMTFLHHELAALTPRLNFGATGLTTLAGWQKRLESPNITLDRAGDDGGKPALHIAAPRGGTGAWFTRARLDPGRYVLQAVARSQKLVPATGGTGLRTSGGKPTEQLSGDSPWKMLSYEFEVPEGSQVVELICELNCKEGEVWFQADSLKLLRVK